MESTISQLLARYENGGLSRRRLIQGLAALAGASQAAVAAPTFTGVDLNHIAIRVTDIPRSRDFYKNLFGMPVIRESGTSCFLGLGNNFLTLFKNEKPGLDHYCIAIQNFDADSAMQTLTSQGRRPRRAAGTDRIYFPDPDGIEVQISARDHRA
jgi:catechol 2,3-dioxygenase-like lactoylglutathione lyase family enzyme